MRSPKTDHKDETKNNPIIDIRKRAFELAVRIIKLCRYLEDNRRASPTLVYQLIKSGTSIGANLEEAQAGQSKADFIHKNAIALKEARETNYWLRLLCASYEFEESVMNGISEIENESGEIANIIGSIIVTAKRNK